MLTAMTIRDFVLVDRLELSFASGFGVLTGETGAGKSILVDALAFVLGERADSSLIRPGAERTEVTAEFSIAGVDGVESILKRQEVDCEDGCVLLRRTTDGGGRSRAWLNGTPVTLQQLREVTDLLVDIHGQHAHQSLLRGESQRALLDAYGNLEALAASVGDAYQQWQAANDTWKRSLNDGESLRRQREVLEWEVEELSTLQFSAEEWVNLNAEQSRLANATALVEGAAFCVQRLGESEYSCLSQLDSVVSRLEALCAFDPSLDEPAKTVGSAHAEIADALATLRRYGERMELDPGRLAEVDQRIEAILDVARKFRVQPDGLVALLEDRRAQLAALGDSADPERLRRNAEKAEQDYRTLAQQLSAERKTAADRLGAEVSTQLSELALGGGRFEIALLAVDDGTRSGLERVEFRVGGLAGSEMRPLAKVASGGELSRISLALQVAASRATRVPSLIFDEIDVGIGGGVAEIVGRLMRTLGRSHQVLCVTHLPQVAACADWQWRVSKAKVGDSFLSRVASLDAAEREEEIARMLGGVEITPVTRQHAREMLAVAESVV